MTMSEEIRVLVDAGACKMRTLVTAKENDMGLVEIEIRSDCPNILKLSWNLEPMSPYSEVEALFSESSIYKLAEHDIPHTACPVPAGIVKALEVAGGLGLKRDSIIHFVGADEVIEIK